MSILIRKDINLNEAESKLTSNPEQFQLDLKKGEIYEQLFFAMLFKHGYKPEYSRGMKEFDISAGSLKFEVKYDSYTKENNRIAVELWSNRRLNNQGWIWYTKADVLIYFISGTEYYWIDMPYLKDFVNTTFGMYEEKVAYAAGNPDAVIISIPIKDLNQERIIKKEVLR